MAGIKLLEKRPGNLDFIINELIKPGVKEMMFDDAFGMAEISHFLYSPFTMVYGIFAKGHPIPIGTVILDEVRPFRGCEVHAAIFKPEDRNTKVAQAVAQSIKQDMILKMNLHYASARTLSDNYAASHLLEKLGMKKIGTKPGNVVSNGKYCDVDEFYLVLDGDKLFNLDREVPHGREDKHRPGSNANPGAEGLHGHDHAGVN
jgi:RimJ/RimL family protein N-acetyltransferase